MRAKEFIIESADYPILVDYDKVVSVFKKIWNQHYSDIKIHTYDNSDDQPGDEIWFSTDPEFESDYGGKDDFYLNVSVYIHNMDDNGDIVDPYMEIVVGHGYAGKYRGIVGKFFGALYNIGPPGKYRKLWIQGDGSMGEWDSIAKKLKAHIWSSSSVGGNGEGYDYSGTYTENE